MRTASVFGRYCYELDMIEHKAIPYSEQAQIAVGQEHQVQSTPQLVHIP